MQDELKRLIELASADLSFAEMEVRFAESPNDALRRIGYHLAELRRYVDDLARVAEGELVDEGAVCRRG